MTVELTHLFKIARTSLDERGVLATVKHGPHYLKTYLKRRKAWRTFEEQDGFDRQHGTDTTAMLGPRILAIPLKMCGTPLSIGQLCPGHSTASSGLCVSGTKISSLWISDRVRGGPFCWHRSSLSRES